MSRRIDLTGQKFGRLTVTSFNEEVSLEKKEPYWNCVCECGNIKVVHGGNLRHGRVKSCGCYRVEQMRSVSKKAWEDDEFKRKKADEMKERWKDESFKQEQKERIKKQVTEQWKDEDYRKKVSDKQSIISKERWKDDDYKTKHKQGMEKAWESEELRERHAKTVREAWQDEELRRKQSENMKKVWEDEEYKRKQSENMKGEKNPSYNPNITDEERQGRRKFQEGYDEWCKKVKENANFTCDCCGARGGKLHSHHLDGYNWCKERRTDISNGVCLCENCHKEFHHYFGKGNNTEQQYIEFKENYKKCE